MDSLTTDPVAAVLRRLYQEAERADRPLMERYRDRGVALDELLKAEAKDYRAVYRTYANNFLNVSADLADSSTCVPAPVRPSGSLNSARHSVSQLFISPARWRRWRFDRQRAGARQSKACSRRT